jgi:hypothetical protein
MTLLLTRDALTARRSSVRPDLEPLMRSSTRTRLFCFGELTIPAGPAPDEDRGRCPVLASAR